MPNPSFSHGVIAIHINTHERGREPGLCLRAPRENGYIFMPSTIVEETNENLPAEEGATVRFADLGLSDARDASRRRHGLRDPHARAGGLYP